MLFECKHSTISYGLHKEDIPLQPIVSAIGSPTYKLAKELARILAPLAGNTSSFVNNSTEFVNKVCSIELEEDDILVSFDVVSLFTKVPIDKALKVISQCLLGDDDLLVRTPIPAEDIIMFFDRTMPQVHVLHSRIDSTSRWRVLPWDHPYLQLWRTSTWSTLRRWPWTPPNSNPTSD